MMGVPAPPGVFDRNLVASEGEPLADVFTAIRKYFDIKPCRFAL
jgi:hypothetical protein